MNPAGEGSSLETTCGIKQGCKVAPYLFVALALSVMDSLAERISWDWLINHFTFYADDAFAAWLIQSVQDLRDAFKGVQTVIDTFQDHGMRISPAKSAILYDLHGIDVHKNLKP